LPKDADGGGGWFLLIVPAPFGPEVQISQGFGGTREFTSREQEVSLAKKLGQTRKKIEKF